jgi:hypothetical protein
VQLDGSTGNDDVKPAEALHRRRHSRLDLLLMPHIGGQRQSLVTISLQLSRYPCYPISRHPGDSDTGACGGHMSCTRRADPGATPCDQCHLSF